MVVPALPKMPRNMRRSMSWQASARVSRDLRQDLYGKLVHAHGVVLRVKRGDVMSRFTHDSMEVEHSVIGSLEALLKSPLMVLVSLATLLAPVVS